MTASVCCLLKTLPSPLTNCHMPSDVAVGSSHMKCPLVPSVQAMDLSGYGSGGAVVPQVAQRLSGVALCGMWHRLHLLDAGGGFVVANVESGFWMVARCVLVVI